MSNKKQGGIVYVLENAAMPGIVKIGKTSRDSIKERLNELYSTGVPVPFDCVYAARVGNEVEVEKAFHEAFGPNRINPKREFFEIDSGQAIAVLRLVAVEDVTPDVQKEAVEIDEDSQAGARKLRSRRPNLNFDDMRIPLGSELKFTKGDETVVVISDRRVKYQESEFSLTAITRVLLGVERDVRPTPYWTFQGRLLQEIYRETYEELA